MHILLVTEIWGRTPYVDLMVGTLKSVAKTVSVVDPYDGDDPGFTCEEDAYARYLEACGPVKYALRVSRALQQVTTPVCLVGFSAGAGAVWSAICGTNVGCASGALCFYGSSIRTMLDRVPRVPVDLIFPARELHFDVAAVVGALRQKPMTRCHVTSSGHGFMNPLSVNYDVNAYAQWLPWMQERVASFFGQRYNGGR